MLEAPPTVGQGQGRVVGGRVLDRAAGECERVGGRVVEVGRVVAGAECVVEGQRRAAGAGAVGGGAAGVERERRRAGDGDVLAEGDGDRDQRAGRVGAVGLRRGDVGDGRRGGVVDEGAGGGAGVAGGVGGAGGDRVGVAVGELAGEGGGGVGPGGGGAAGGVVEDRGLVEGGAAPVVAGAVLDRDLHGGDGAGAAGVGGGAGEVAGEAGGVVGVAVDGRRRDGGGRVGGVDDDRFLAADARGAADGREGQGRVVGGGVLDRAAGERERVGGRVVEVGGVVAAGDRCRRR